MPKLDLRQTEERTDLTLADVPEGDWWLDTNGIPYQRENSAECVYYDPNCCTFCISSMLPKEVKILRKVCGPIELIWE